MMMLRIFLLTVLFNPLVIWALEATVRHVIDGDTFVTESGEHVRLLDINTPEVAHGRHAAEVESATAKQRLKALVQGQAVRLETATKPRDRYGRLLAHVYRTSDNLWVNGTLVEEGLAHVYTFPDNAAKAVELQQLEAQAINNQQGVWRHARFAPKRATQNWSKQWLGKYQVVDGRVLSAQKVGKNIYLNFGADWRTDFTVAIEKDDWDTFKQAGLDPVPTYRGKTVRVRGVAMPVNGVLIRATHPAQLEIR